jgi:polygalacturonase
VYIAKNTFSTGDDCIAIKAGRDWSGIMVNISTQNVLAEQNYFMAGHGVSIGSEVEYSDIEEVATGKNEHI